MTLGKIQKPNYTLDSVRLQRIAEVGEKRYAAHVKFLKNDWAFKIEAEHLVSNYLYLHDIRHKIESSKFSNPYTIVVIFTT